MGYSYREGKLVVICLNGFYSFIFLGLESLKIDLGGERQLCYWFLDLCWEVCKISWVLRSMFGLFLIEMSRKIVIQEIGFNDF